jgi:type I restriction enzyme S subunit
MAVMFSEVSLPEDFKETEIGPIPVEWDVVPLSQAAEHKKATLDPRSHPAEVFDYYSIPAYRASDQPALQHGSQIRSQKLVVESGTVLFGKLNPRAPKIWLVASTSARRKVASTEFIPLVPIDGKTASEFLYYLAWSDYVLPKSQELASGSTPSRQRVDVKAFLRIPIPLPPLPEQRRIVHVLSTIQRAISAQDDLIAAARQVKRSLMQRLFTYGPGPEPAPTKETEIGEIPAHWEVVKLGNLIRSDQLMVQNGFPCGNHNQQGIGIPHLRPFNVDSNGQIVLETLKYVETDRDVTKYLLRPGDIVFNNTNSENLVGKTAYWNRQDDFVLSNHMTIIRVPDLEVLNSFFLASFLHKKWYDGLYQRLCHRYVNQASVSLARLKNISIPLAPPPEQQQIAQTISAAARKIEAEEQRKAALGALFKTVLHQLMTGQVRV